MDHPGISIFADYRFLRCLRCQALKGSKMGAPRRIDRGSCCGIGGNSRNILQSGKQITVIEDAVI